MVEQRDEYWVPECVRAYLRGAGFSTRVLEDMEPRVREWDSWMRAIGEFYDYRDTDGFGRVYQVHRRTIMPAMRVCREWGSLLLDEKITVACDDQKCTDWLGSFFSSTNFWGRAQETVVRAFGLGTGAFALWLDVRRKAIKIRHYDARMVVPLSWDSEGIGECAFVTRAFVNGESIDQVQMHVVGSDGAYLIRTVCFDRDGREVSVPGVSPEVRTGCPSPTFGIVKPAVPNTRVDFSPYGQSVFADAIDAVQSVDLAYDALINEIDAGKMRVFLSDVMFDQEKTTDGKRIPIPFGKGDCTVFRKVMSTEDTITEFAPALRTEAQGKAFRLALQVLGDLVGLGVNYFDTDNVGYVKTATEVSSDNSALMRNIRKNENALQGALCDVFRAVMTCARNMGTELPDEGNVSVIFDDSIIQDTASEKKQDMAEVAAGLMTREEYRSRWYGEASGGSGSAAGAAGRA
ncbi:MAG: phage portal protein [Eggerthellaceae bacterium]|jgi:A118 family predicted phage portal protein